MKKKLPFGALERPLLGQRALLLPQKCLYWAEGRALLLADWHLGKAGHFRKAGVPVSGKVHSADFAALETALASLVEAGERPERLLVLGDLFHAEYNREWEALAEWLAAHPGLAPTLVMGNHDVIAPELVRAAGFRQVEELTEGPFLLTHHPQASVPEGLYNLHGHIHPCVTLKGKGRDRLRLPCFHFGARRGTLPAFGRFTGGAKVAMRPGEEAFVVAQGKVLAVRAG